MRDISSARPIIIRLSHGSNKRSFMRHARDARARTPTITMCARPVLDRPGPGRRREDLGPPHTAPDIAPDPRTRCHTKLSVHTRDTAAAPTPLVTRLVTTHTRIAAHRPNQQTEAAGPTVTPPGLVTASACKSNVTGPAVCRTANAQQAAPLTIQPRMCPSLRCTGMLAP